jgi:internalin A
LKWSERQARNQLFISYSHCDARFLKEFQPHLKFLEESGLVNFWDDQKILPGMKWRKEIEEALARTRVALLLVSPDFLASDFITREELPMLLEAAQKGEVMIWPLLVSSCLFAESPLAVFQAVHDPTRPLDGLKTSERKKVWTQVAAQLASALQEDT